MPTWWIDGVKDDAALAAALRQEANETPFVSLGKLLEVAAARIEELSKLAQTPDE